MSARADLTWPLYFAAKDLVATRVTFQKGDLFPIQDKQVIRGYGPAYGVKDADRRAFADLGYVEVLDVRTEEMARQIREQGLNAAAAKRLVGRVQEAA